MDLKERDTLKTLVPKRNTVTVERIHKTLNQKKSLENNRMREWERKREREEKKERGRESERER